MSLCSVFADDHDDDRSLLPRSSVGRDQASGAFFIGDSRSDRAQFVIKRFDLLKVESTATYVAVGLWILSPVSLVIS
jgi:hypothetical protein